MHPSARPIDVVTLRQDFGYLHEGSEAAAQRILPLLNAIRPFGTVIDVGCGGGEWLRAALEFGARRVCGIDESPPTEEESTPNLEFFPLDLEKRVRGFARRDLCLCLEVAEHLSAKRGETLVNDLAKLSDVIAFSAAIPCQGGLGHINEQWPEYWAAQFQIKGYLPFAGIRRQIWMDRSIPWWYRQNLIVYIKADVWPFLIKEQPHSPTDLTRVHPECFLWNARHRGNDELRTFHADRFYDLHSGPGAAESPF